MDPAVAPIEVRANRRHPRAPWEVALPGHGGHVHCETLDEARRIAYLCRDRRRPCEITVYDAYDRVIEHELIR